MPRPSPALLLLGATALAVGWASSPWGSTYLSWRDAVEPAVVDGLLAVFFLVVGLELKRELTLGSLRDPRRAALPVAAAVCGMLVPALVYLAVNLTAAHGDPRGWAVPTATDIAFALGVLGLLGRGLPPALRTFLLTLAVVDDLLAITVIAVGYSEGVRPWLLLAALVPVTLVATTLRGRRTDPLVLAVLGIATWALVHGSGVHPTVAGVAVGLAVPAARVRTYEAALEPWSSLVVVPVFALVAAGVDVGATGGPGELLRDPVAIGVALGLVIGKPVGVCLAVGVLPRVCAVRLDPSLTARHVLGLGLLAGIGLTVSLLIGHLAFGDGARADHVTLAVLAASAAAATAGALVLRGSRGQTGG